MIRVIVSGSFSGGSENRPSRRFSEPPLNLITDQYSLGCVLYFCLTGDYPFADGTAAEKMMAHQMKQPKPVRERNPDVPEELAAIVERLMQKAPEARFASTAEAVEALRPLASEAPARARPPIVERPAPSVPAPPQALTETPRPGPGRATTVAPVLPAKTPARPAKALAVTLPSRQSIQTNPAPAPQPAPTPQPATRTDPDEKPPTPSRSWEERLGPVGLTACALAVCAVAWLVTRYLLP